MGTNRTCSDVRLESAFAERKTYAQLELFPKAVISHNASIARLYLGLLFSSAAEQVVLAGA